MDQGFAAKHPIAVGLGVVAAAAGLGAVVGATSDKNDPGWQGVAAVGGAVFGAAGAGVAGLVVGAASKRYRKPALMVAKVGLGSLAAMLAVGGVVSAVRALKPAPAPVGPLPSPSPTPAPQPPGPIAWTQIPATTTLQPQIVYRVSDMASAADLQSPPTVDNMNAYLASTAIVVDGVWIASPPADWPAADTMGTQPRIYMEFSVTSAGAQLPGLTSAARLFVQKAVGA